LRQGEPAEARQQRFWHATAQSSLDDPRLARAPRQRQALAILKQHPHGVSHELLNQLQINKDSLDLLKEKGLVELEVRRHSTPPREGGWLAQAELPLNPEQRAALEEQLRGLRQLASEGYVPRNRLLDSERLLAQVNGEIAGDLGSLGSTRRQILELRLRMAQRREKFQEEVRGSLADAQVRAEELRNRLASARFDLANSEVRAPVAGLVVGQEVFTEGGVIAPGQQLMEILPERQPLLVDARLPVEMVDKVRVGLPVELMFSAFSQSTTPRVEGEVTLVSADRLLDERSEAPYYRVRIRVGEEGVRRLAGLEIRPGMPVEAFVRSGERSLLNYLFKPLADRTHLALGEE